MQQLKLILSLLLSFGFITACGSGSDKPDQPAGGNTGTNNQPTFAKVDEECSKEKKCGKNLFCINDDSTQTKGICKTGCRTNSDCSENKKCTSIRAIGHTFNTARICTDAPPQKKEGELCTLGSSCYNEDIPLVCFQGNNTTPTCQKKCTKEDDCNTETQTCKKFPRFSLCVSNNPDGIQYCPTYFEELKAPMPFNETKVNPGEGYPDLKAVDKGYQYSFQSGKLTAGKDDNQTESMFFIDFDSDFANDPASLHVNISDKEAFTNNKNWDIAVRGWLVVTNGALYPGNVKVAYVADGTKEDMDTYTLEMAQKISDETYKDESPISQDCENIYKLSLHGGIKVVVSTAIGQLNSDTDNCAFGLIGNSPNAKEKGFYVIKRNDKYTIFKFTNVSKANKVGDPITYTMYFRNLS